ncbi:MAG TPA: hypothetical protein VGH28_07540 [Polyangiaceae bacterium]|jgi:hypothetical protein
MHASAKILLVLGAATLFTACKKESSVTLAESASALAAEAPPPSAKVVAYTIDPASKTAIDMPGLKEHIVADTDGAAGKLDVDVMNLANTRGEVKIDLTTLKTHTFNDDKDASQTHHALNWLQVGDTATADEKTANQYAVFAIRSLDGLSEANVSKVAPKTEGAEEIRTVTGTAHGEFLLHGHKANKDVPIEARFHYPAGAKADSNPTKIDIKSTAPLKVTLKEHDIHPRDNFGKLASWTTNLVAKVAETADVSLDLHANLTH